MIGIDSTKPISNMANIDYRKVFDIGAKVTLAEHIVDNVRINPRAPLWQKDCFNAQNSKEGLVIRNVGEDFVQVQSKFSIWTLGIGDLNLRQLRQYIDKPEILYAFAENQATRSKPRNICEDLDTAFLWRKTPEGEGFWSSVYEGGKVEYPNKKESQQTNQNTNNHEIRLQKQKSLVSHGGRPEGTRVRSTKHKASIRSRQISNTACHL